MLSKADTELVERDLMGSSLATLLDPDAFLAWLSEHGFPGSFERAELGYLRFVPGTACLATYRLYTREGHVDVYAKTLQADDPLLGSEPGEAEAPIRVVLSSPPIVVCAFPHDLRLRSIARLEDRGQRERLLGRILSGRPALVGATIEPLRYRPERRYVCRLRSEGVRDAVLKFYRKREFLSADQRARRFEPRDRLFPIARVGSSERHRVVAYDWCPGEPLRDLLEAPVLAADSVHAVGFALAELHAQDPTELRALTREQELAAAFRTVDRLEHLLPPLGSRARGLLARATRRLDAPVESRTLHGDFYGKQVLLEEGRVTFLDLDSAGRGDPSVDLGQFLAHLERDETLGLLPRGRAAEAGAQLLDGYAEKTGEAQRDLAATIAVGLLRLSTYPFRRRLENWPAASEALVARADQILAGP
jgi:aminoglycoside phosphotransferase (APT) family kinase protein